MPANEQEGVVQLIRMVLDEQAKKQLEDEMQDALRKGSDPKEAKKNLRETDGEFKKLNETIKKVFEFLALREVFRFGKEAVAAALESRREWGLLEKAVNNTGASYTMMAGRIKEVSDTFKEAGVAGDEEFAGALRTLTQISGDAQKSLQNMTVVADLAAARNLDLGTAADLVAKAMNGQVTMLQRLGIEIPKGADAVKILAEQFRGSAMAVDPAVRAQKTLVETWDDLKEAVGEALLSVNGGENIFQSIIKTMKALAKVVDENHEAISLMAQTIWWFVRFAGAAMLGLFSGLATVVAGVTDGLIAFYDALSHALNAVGIATPGWAAQKKALDEFSASAHKAADGADKLARSIIDPKNPAAATKAPTIETGEVGGSMVGAKMGPDKTPEQLAKDQEDALQKRIQTATDALKFDNLRAEGLSNLIDLEAELSKKIDEGNLSFEDRVQAQKDLKDVQDALVDGLKGMAAQAGVSEEALNAMWEGNWKAALKSFTKEAAMSAAWNLAKAAEEFARAWGWIGLGNFPSAAAAHASAAGHLAAAGKWAALAGGGAAAAGGGGSGAGGAGSGSATGALGTDAASAAKGSGVQVTVWVDGFDPDNTRHQDRIYAAAQDIRERYGEDSFIDIKQWRK